MVGHCRSEAIKSKTDYLTARDNPSESVTMSHRPRLCADPRWPSQPEAAPLPLCKYRTVDTLFLPIRRLRTSSCRNTTRPACPAQPPSVHHRNGGGRWHGWTPERAHMRAPRPASSSSRALLPELCATISTAKLWTHSVFLHPCRPLSPVGNHSRSGR